MARSQVECACFGVDWRSKREVELEARVKTLEAALKEIQIGGNHLACVLMQDADFPKADVPEEKVAHYFGAGSTMHDVWICWRAIMRTQDLIP